MTSRAWLPGPQVVEHAPHPPAVHPQADEAVHALVASGAWWHSSCVLFHVIWDGFGGDVWEPDLFHQSGNQIYPTIIISTLFEQEV